MAGQKQKPMDFALKMLSIRDYGKAELRARMETKGFNAEEIEPVLSVLEGKKLLDDALFIGKIIEKYTLKTPHGKEFIRDYLEKKGLKKEQFGEQLERIDERASAKLAYGQKFKRAKTAENPSKMRQKAAIYLQTKGFDYDIIVEILNEEIKGDYENEL